MSIQQEPQSGELRGTVVLLHGLGADEHDLMSLASFLDSSLQVVCPRAPMQSPWGGYSWFGIEIDERGLVIDVDEARSSLAILIDFLSALPRPVLLGGFSQGAMMSVGVLLEQACLIDGAILMSGGILPCFTPVGYESKPVFASHGDSDPVVPFEFGQLGAQRLLDLGSQVEFHTYPMGHQISDDCLSDLTSWVRNWRKTVDIGP